MCACVCRQVEVTDAKAVMNEGRSGGSGETVIFFLMWGGLLWLVWRVVVDHRVWCKRCRGGRCR